MTPTVRGATEFEAEVLGQADPVLVACLDERGEMDGLAEAVHTAAKSFEGEIRVRLVDSDLLPMLRNRLGVTGTPTILLFKEGRECSRLLGRFEDEHILAFLRRHLDATAH
ncbi:thioredoxin family protein [Desulfohalovibrio reitneri]|uniref:thioredoxin family protein n=1 Tax=Desulfohalovibrio reitneri TaxID=1307759 RepID=UPI00068F8C35|nr:thioredoxin domain-containing protein [Desulfohalovibrio reitneri]